MNSFDNYVRQLSREEHFELPWDCINTLAVICENLPETPCSGTGRKKTKRLGFMLVAAVLLIGLSATAVANFRVGEWFEKYFCAETRSGLSESQVSVIEAKTTDVGRSCTVNGYTVTIDSIINDDYTVYIRLRVTAPEGSVFTDKKRYFFENFGFGKVSEAGRPYYGHSGSCAILDYGDAPDNVLPIMLKLDYSPNSGTGFSISDKPSRTLQLSNLCDGYSKQGTDKWGNDLILPHTVIDGSWSIEVALKNNGGSVELVKEPVQGHGVTGERGLEGAPVDVDVTLTSFALSTFGAKITYEPGKEARRGEALDFPSITVYMKDGTLSVLQMKSSACGEGPGIATLEFLAPVDLGQVDYVKMKDGVVLKAS